MFTNEWMQSAGYKGNINVEILDADLLGSIRSQPYARVNTPRSLAPRKPFNAPMAVQDARTV